MHDRPRPLARRSSEGAKGVSPIPPEEESPRAGLPVETWRRSRTKRIYVYWGVTLSLLAFGLLSWMTWPSMRNVLLERKVRAAISLYRQKYKPVDPDLFIITDEILLAGPTAGPVLDRLLTDNDPHVRKSFLYCLVQSNGVGGYWWLPWVVKSLDDDDRICVQYALYILQELPGGNPITEYSTIAEGREKALLWWSKEGKSEFCDE
jgi:hypothetical protein